MAINNGMVVHFRVNCEFVFKGWSTTADETGLFFFGCLIVMFYCMLHMNLYTVKLILPKNLIVDICWYLVYALSGIMVMQLIMTMNGWVNLAVIIGSTIGYSIQESWSQIYEKENQAPPGGCEFCN
ncbi:unnamed protein product [Paramecium octaurelia]|uniref:Copper transporter n=1 Tax=Paramecium octaurelia TaxID=43137 RepID=A0A8S1TKL9_PAROT|nr:unnamed protein product [Paramecium octaurelia]